MSLNSLPLLQTPVASFDCRIFTVDSAQGNVSALIVTYVASVTQGEEVGECLKQTLQYNISSCPKHTFRSPRKTKDVYPGSSS